MCTAQPLAISTVRLSLTSFLHALALLRCVPSTPSFSRRPLPLLHSLLHMTASSWPGLPVNAIALTTKHVTGCAPPPITRCLPLPYSSCSYCLPAAAAAATASLLLSLPCCCAAAAALLLSLQPPCCCCPAAAAAVAMLMHPFSLTLTCFAAPPFPPLLCPSHVHRLCMRGHL